MFTVVSSLMFIVPHHSNLVCDAFDKAKIKFSSALTHDQNKVDFINSHHTIEDVQNAVADAVRMYEARKTSPKAMKWLHGLSKRVRFYGDVMDMLVQHHPEYVSLAWGAMKFLLIVYRLTNTL
jgi:predicted ATP-binding protein involved in virulence